MTFPKEAKHKKCRRLGQPVCGSEKCPFFKRPYPPGMHGQRRQKLSAYGMQLQEKQKLKFTYGVSETQLRNLYREAAGSKGNTGEILMSFLECRLGNIVYRLGFAQTRPGARQMVSHRQIMVNDKIVNIASFRVKPKDRIRVSETSRMYGRIKERLKEADLKRVPPYLVLDPAKAEGSLERLPRREEIPEVIEMRMIIEFYAK